MRRLLARPAALAARLLARSYYFTQFARIVVKEHDNDSNSNMETNGEGRLQKLISGLSDETSVFVDVGANVGKWSAALIRSGARGRLIAVDPLRRNLEAVRQKLEQAGCTRFDLCQVALSESGGKVKFFTNRDTALSGHDSLFDMRTIGYRDPVDCIEVDTDTLDNLSAKLGIAKILLLKADVEGHELSVLKGARDLLSREAIDFVQFEFGHAARAARVYLHDIVSYLAHYPYELFVIKPQGLAPLHFSPFTENRYAYVNLFASRSACLDRIRGSILKR